MSAAEQGQSSDAGTGLRARLAEVRQRIDACALGAGRDPSEITLIAVSKTHSAEVVAAAAAVGVTDLGENRVQEAESKIVALAAAGGPHLRWHLIGHLQSNKARRAVRLFEVIHTVDSAALVGRLEKLCEEEERAELPVLVQLSLADEATKAGATESELPSIVEEIDGCKRVRLVGLMTLPPFFDEVERVRAFFRRLRELRDGLRARDAFRGRAGELSMGMSHDFELAVEEGATMVRVGTAIFGARGRTPA